MAPISNSAGEVCPGDANNDLLDGEKRNEKIDDHNSQGNNSPRNIHIAIFGSISHFSRILSLTYKIISSYTPTVEE